MVSLSAAQIYRLLDLIEQAATMRIVIESQAPDETLAIRIAGQKHRILSTGELELQE